MLVTLHCGLQSIMGKTIIVDNIKYHIYLYSYTSKAELGLPTVSSFTIWGSGCWRFTFMLLGGLQVSLEGSTAITPFMVSSVRYIICKGPKLDA